MKILVVEDNRKLARFLYRALSEEDHVTDVVHDGITAIEQVSTVEYDLVVLDWMLPEMDGLSVCRTLRARGSRVPILMLTARVAINERITGLNAGADDYLSKPFDLGELLARVRALHRRAETAGVVSRVGPLVVDRSTRVATLDGRDLALTPREFSLLSHLAAESGRTVARTELLAKCWENTSDPGSNVVDVHVRNLREKLGRWSALIETVRGVGYRMNEP
jgi:two-component system, OmpR family, response regulator